MKTTKTLFLLGTLMVLIAGNTKADLYFSFAYGGSPTVGAVNPSGVSRIYATNTPFAGGNGITSDVVGNLFMAYEQANYVMKISRSTGLITTFASAGNLSGPSALAFDKNGNLFVLNYAWINQASILKITPNGDVSVFASVGGGGSGLAFNSKNELFAVDYAYSHIWKISTNGVVSTFASGSPINAPTSLAFDKNDNLFVANQGYGNTTPTISKITPSGAVSTFWSAGSYQGLYLDSLAIDANGNLFAGYGNSILNINSSGVANTFVNGLAGAPAGLVFWESSNISSDTYVLAIKAATQIQQPSSTNLSGLITTPVPLKSTFTTATILSYLALDEHAAGNYPSSTFPAGALLVVRGDSVIVTDSSTNELVDVSDILTAQTDDNSVFSGKQNNATGLAAPMLSEIQYQKLVYDDSAITNGAHLSFTLGGLATVVTKDTVNAIAGTYSETVTSTVNSGAGTGNFQGTPFILSGSITATCKKNATVP